VAKITLITQWFPPEPAYLWKDLASALQDNGHDVTVITSFPNYPHGKIYDGYKQTLSSTEYIDRLKVVRLPVYPNHSPSIIKRGFSYLSFTFSVIFIGIFKIGKPDIILCYSPPLTTGVAAALLAKFKKVPFILNVQDMWPDTLISSGMIKKGFLTNTISIVANWLYKNAKAVVVLSDGFNEHLVTLGVPPRKVHTISNWSSDINDKPNKSNDENKWRKKLYLDKHDFIVMFAGNIGPAQALDSVLEAAEIVKKTNNRIKFVFVGSGLALESLKKQVEKNTLNNVIFCGRIPYEDMNQLYDIADALLIHLKKDDLFKVTIPHKLLTYLSIGKPIISAVTGEVNNIVDKSSAGFSSPSENPKKLSESILKTANLTQENKDKIKKDSQLYFSRNFTKEILLKKWEAIVSNSLKTHNKS
jgi:glycosyltransferase involved in cell wall biosynthesis